MAIDPIDFLLRQNLSPDRDAAVPYDLANFMGILGGALFGVTQADFTLVGYIDRL